MQIIAGDILLRKEKDDQTVWISQRLICGLCLVTESYLKDRVRPAYKKTVPPSQQSYSVLPDTGKAWRWAKMQGQFYYSYENIPDRAPSHYRSKLPSREELINLSASMEVQKGHQLKEYAQELIQEKIDNLIDSADINYFRYSASHLFAVDKAKELARSCAWMRYISDTLSKGSFKALGITKKENFLEVCLSMIIREDLEGLRINKVKSLRNKLAKWPVVGDREQRESMLSGKYGNSNAAIVGKFEVVDPLTGEILSFDIHQALMYHLYMSPGMSIKPDKIALYEQYTSEVKDFALEPVSYRAFCKHLSRFDREHIMSLERHGSDYFNKQVLPYVPGQSLNYAHSLFSADGSGTIGYKYYNANGDLKSMNAYVILVSDTYSKKITGWGLAPEGSHKETIQMVKKAVEMTLESANYSTLFELVTDNHGAFTSEESREFLGHIFNKVRTIQVGNSQSNPAETQFRLFKKVLKGFHNFLRTSWGSCVQNQANPDYVSIENLPNYDEAVIMLESAISTWNNKVMADGSTPNARWEKKHPDCKAIDPRVIRFCFGKVTKKYTRYLRGFIDVENTLLGKYKFEIPDYLGDGASKIAKAINYNQNGEIEVRWNDKGADIYTLEGQYIMTCEPTQKASISHAETSEEGLKGLGHHKQRKEDIIESAKTFTKQVEQTRQALQEIIDEEKMPYRLAVALKENKESINARNEQIYDEEEMPVKVVVKPGLNSPRQNALDQI